MEAKILVITLIAILVAAAASTVTASPDKIAGVLYTIDVHKISSGKLSVTVIMEMTVSDHEGTKLVVPIGLPLSKAKLVSFNVLVGGKDIVKSAKLETKGLLRAVAELSEPIREGARVVVKVSGTVKSTAKLYVTKDYKLYKDYKPVNKKILYLDVINYYYDTVWDTATVDNTKVPGLRIRIIAPPGWEVFYARSSLTGKLRYMEIKSLAFDSSGRMYVEYWWLDTKKITPKSFKPGDSFAVEVGFQPRSDYTNPVSLAVGIVILALAALFAWYYRDVWKYTSRKILQK